MRAHVHMCVCVHVCACVCVCVCVYMCVTTCAASEGDTYYGIQLTAFTTLSLSGS